MARFDFQSPGAAFTEQMAEVLAQRKVEERQRMLDQLTTNADARAAEAAARDERESQARIENQEFQRKMAELGTFTQFMKRGDDPNARGVSPELFETGKKYGMFEKIPTPQVTTSEAVTSVDGMSTGESAPAPAEAPPPPAQDRYGYVGSLPERQLEERKAGNARLIASLLGDKEKQEAGRYLQSLYDATGGEIPGDAIAEVMGPGGQLYIFDEAKGRLLDAAGRPVDTSRIPRNAKIVTRGHPPASYANSFQERYVGISEDGHPITIGKDGKLHVDTSVKMRPGANEAPLGIGQGLLTRHQALLGAVAEAIAEEDDSSIASSLAMFKNSAQQIIGAAKMSPTAKRLLLMMINEPAAFAQAKQTVKMDENEMSQFMQLRGSILSPEIEELLRAQAKPKRNKWE